MAHVLPIWIRIAGAYQLLDAIRDNDTIPLSETTMLEMHVVAVCRLSLFVWRFVCVDVIRNANKHPPVLSRLARLTSTMSAWAGGSAGTRHDGHGWCIDCSEK